MAAAALAISLSAGGVSAAVVETSVLFKYLSDTNDVITFEVPLSSTPDFFTSDSFFVLANVPISVAGSPSGVDDFTFYSLSAGGGLADAIYFPGFGITAAQLYIRNRAVPNFFTRNVSRYL